MNKAGRYLADLHDRLRANLPGVEGDLAQLPDLTLDHVEEGECLAGLIRLTQDYHSRLMEAGLAYALGERAWQVETLENQLVVDSLTYLDDSKLAYCVALLPIRLLYNESIFIKLSDALTGSDLEVSRDSLVAMVPFIMREASNPAFSQYLDRCLTLVKRRQSTQSEDFIYVIKTVVDRSIVLPHIKTNSFSRSCRLFILYLSFYLNAKEGLFDPADPSCGTEWCVTRHFINEMLRSRVGNAIDPVLSAHAIPIFVNNELYTTFYNMIESVALNCLDPNTRAICRIAAQRMSQSADDVRSVVERLTAEER